MQKGPKCKSLRTFLHNKIIALRTFFQNNAKMADLKMVAMVMKLISNERGERGDYESVI